MEREGDYHNSYASSCLFDSRSVGGVRRKAGIFQGRPRKATVLVRAKQISGSRFERRILVLRKAVFYPGYGAGIREVNREQG
ncbi:hypothetical protein Metal_2783 [Methylomicrobium album BG8]|uniref:Uncharacterized protein n=1 Tax=Methylomicrobium album BG8 TaxID=686340 RepID=H8GKZ4_METAL|nr:hypothetical protein Metal_2783 [Methylomicrobium album BG8]